MQNKYKVTDTMVGVATYAACQYKTMKECLEAALEVMESQDKEYSMEFIDEVTQLCGLCGNSGIVDTRNKVFSTVNIECGVRQFCICPNGRHKRKQDEKNIFNSFPPPEQPIMDKPEPDKDEWIEWNNNGSAYHPDLPLDTLVATKWDDGVTYKYIMPVAALQWHRVTHYCIIKDHIVGADNMVKKRYDLKDHVEDILSMPPKHYDLKDMWKAWYLNANRIYNGDIYTDKINILKHTNLIAITRADATSFVAGEGL